MVMFNSLPQFDNVTEARKMFGFCRVLHDFAIKARREGILALEEGLSENTGVYSGLSGMIWDFFKMLMRLVVDGTDTEVVRDCAKYMISTTNASDEVRLNMMIVAEGVISIQTGDNPRIMLQKLTCMMGWDGRKECLKYLEAEGVDIED